MPLDANEQAIRPTRHADLPVAIRAVAAVGYGLLVVAELLLLVALLREMEGMEVDLVISMIFRMLGSLTLTGGLVLGGAFAPRMPLWARITLIAVGVYVGLSTGGLMGSMPWWAFGSGF